MKTELKTLQDLSIYRPDWFFARRTGAGLIAEAYRTSPLTSIKVRLDTNSNSRAIRTDPLAITEMLEEVLVADQMNNLGIQVIKPEGEGVYAVPLRTIRRPGTIWTPELVPAIVAPYVNGTLLEKVPKEMQPALYHRASLEFEQRIKRAGFKSRTDKPYDFLANILWVPEKKGKGPGKMYFVGLGHLLPLEKGN